MNNDSENLNKLIEFIHHFKTWDSDELFLRDAIATASAKLLIKCHGEVKTSNVTFIAPLLRQVQENIIVIFGIDQGVLSAERFMNEKFKPSTIMTAIEKKGLTVEKEAFDNFNYF